jgi:hypothetical protein
MLDRTRTAIAGTVLAQSGRLARSSDGGRPDVHPRHRGTARTVVDTKVTRAPGLSGRRSHLLSFERSIAAEEVVVDSIGWCSAGAREAAPVCGVRLDDGGPEAAGGHLEAGAFEFSPAFR